MDEFGQDGDDQDEDDEMVVEACKRKSSIPALHRDSCAASAATYFP